MQWTITPKPIPALAHSDIISVLYGVLSCKVAPTTLNYSRVKNVHTCIQSVYIYSEK